MNDRPMGAEMNCEAFLADLEELPVEAPGAATAADWRRMLSESAREHLARCTSCQGALQDFAETREAMAEVKKGLPEPGPWFAARVMARIRAQEKEIEEQMNGVWVNVMRLAPRLAALAAVLLVVGGTWALQLRRADDARQKTMRPAESLFESAPTTLANDDIVATTYEEPR
jgi:hypothetical protein